MRRFLIALVMSMFTLPAAQAVLYESGEPYEFVPRNGKVDAHSFDNFRLRLSDLRGIAVDSQQPSSLRRQYVERRDSLASAQGRLSGPELDVLGACSYRLGHFEGALSAWILATRKDRANFAAYSNLALLNLVRGELRNARLYDSDARSIPPATLPGMTKEQSAWYMKVEGHLRQLIRNRLAETGKGIAPEQLRPDDLFGVEFVGDEGGYQAGHIAAAQKEKLPEDAIAIVQQLMFW